jgi:serine/threonine-protein kinase
MELDPDAANAETVAADTSRTSPASEPPRERATLAGYRVGDRIGSGGMGEVVVAHDERIGRDVAVKRMLDADDDGSRFLREARIQARLEHPAICPVYEIGNDDAGQPFFAMKRLAGRTLADVLKGDPPQQRLLRAFADVCLAVEFAHSRGVVHRDLKPANIVLGDFGEVYVLDWGLARVIGEADAAPTIGDDICSDGDVTQAGATLGTPGYMAPEQIRDAHAVGPAADIYALGAILFELLARESLHARGPNALASTVAGIDGSPARRRTELAIAPELDALCEAALASDPSARPTARVLAERIQQFVDGDRDVARRRELASEHLTSARAALAESRRADAMRAAGRALALDPEWREAAELVTHLMLEPPRELPAELRAEIASADDVATRRHARVGATMFVALLGFLLATGVNGVVSWPLYGALCAFTVVLTLTALDASRRTVSLRATMIRIAAYAVFVTATSLTFSPLILIPGVVCIMTTSLTTYPQLIDRGRAVLAMLTVGWLAPVVLQLAGVLPATWWISGDELHAVSSMVVMTSTSTSALLVGGHVAMILVSGLYASSLARSRRAAQRDVQIQAWHLRQLLPV